MRKILNFILLITLSINCFANVTISNSTLSNVRIAASYPLDQIDEIPVWAFSTRKLRSDYNGYCLRVRRSSDNSEQDIGFNSNKEIDTVALLSFVGTANAYVTAWYDQSGNGKNATQTTAGYQNQIVATGSLIVVNNLVGLYSQGGAYNHFLDLTQEDISDDMTFLLVYSIGSTINTGRLIVIDGTNRELFVRAEAADRVRVYHGDGAHSEDFAINVGYGANIAYLVSYKRNDTAKTETLYINKNEKTQDNTYTYNVENGTGDATILGQAASAAVFGCIPELILFDTELSTANRNLLEDNIIRNFNL